MDKVFHSKTQNLKTGDFFDFLDIKSFY